MSRVAITGIGAVTPLGNDAPTTWQALAEGRSGVGPLRTFDASTMPVRIAGQVRDFAPDTAGPARERRHLSRAALFAAAAAREALRDAGEWEATGPYRRGVAVAGTVGRPELQELVDMSHQLESSGCRDLYRQAPVDVLRRNQNLGTRAVAGAAGARGPMLSLSTACAGAAHAIGEAYRAIQDGDAALMVAGGFDALTTWMDVVGFSLLGALTDRWNDRPERASRPFDADRSGFVLGEGAVFAVLEGWDTAVARGARIHAELVGYGSTLNAYRITDSPPDGGGAIAAMRDALAESGLGPDGIDYVVAHGTSTPGNDLSETVAIKEVFREHAHDLLVSSPKSMTGHLTSAAAGVNLVAALGAIREGVVPPTVNLDHPDPRLDLDYVPNRARARQVRAALVNAFAFGGTNACFVVRAPGHEPQPSPAQEES
ncbi:beta-ketoacyl-[acyl-carrier-protein] synthase family protein [Streptomyces kaniharaensis]|uniref:Beta-ketoacyl-[acyl-carrier-protein] synthase family protein n=1 Tax=Streptomyces kaniharaensis TaxID=212423 RepID=A0A6N7L044_9ACTN|nr:beta-ketoacyl-[acyl-carrier-protein] synthase family protein [Streptomyces kaniharaensis]MQS15554.1 beta-ketoacyl-[acyl-carrier-protein] synthase family protein [Streptomyces kaniharaensis]